MKELDLVNIKRIEFQILLHFKEFSEKNDIRFYLSNGTLLGAVKYNGFIPWDDDVDILVPREDYTRLMKIYPDNERYKLFSYERDKEFAYPFAKLCDLTTKKDEQFIYNGVELGLDIDIFPLDNWKDDKRKAIQDVRKVQNLMLGMNFSKMPYKKGRNMWRTFFKLCTLSCAKLYGTKKYVCSIQKLAKTNSCIELGKYKGCVVWPIYGVREIIPAEVFGNTIEVEFEGELFPAPGGYDKYLRSLYGDYEMDPPVEKQKTHHEFKAYKINER